LVVPVTLSVSEEVRAAIQGQGMEVIPIETLAPPTHIDEPFEGSASKWANTWSKLQVLNMTQFSKVVLIDVDMLVCGNIDDLFAHPSFSAVGAGQRQHPEWVGFNSGLLVLEPSNTLFEQASIQLQNGTNENWNPADSKYFTSDQDVFNSMIPDWQSRPRLHLAERYQVFAGGMEEGIDYIADAEKHGLRLIASIDQIGQNKSHDMEHTIMVVHFAQQKPWDPGPMPPGGERARKLWQDVAIQAKVVVPDATASVAAADTTVSVAAADTTAPVAASDTTASVAAADTTASVAAADTTVSVAAADTPVR